MNNNDRLRLMSLYIAELRDLYCAEVRSLRIFPALVGAVHDEGLRSALRRHAEQTNAHKYRLEKVFHELGVSPVGGDDRAFAGLLEAALRRVQMVTDWSTRDAGVVIAVQRIEHFEISTYRSARVLAKQLGHRHHAALLQSTLSEETTQDRLLSRLAQVRLDERSREHQLSEASTWPRVGRQPAPAPA